MRSALLAGFLLLTIPVPGFADTISNPTVNGQLPDHCPAVVNDPTKADCSQEMVAASAVCVEYGFKTATSYTLQQTFTKGVQFQRMAKASGEVYQTRWVPDDIGATFIAIQCSN
jgi:hypothetical protein